MLNFELFLPTRRAQIILQSWQDFGLSMSNLITSVMQNGSNALSDIVDFVKQQAQTNESVKWRANARMDNVNPHM